MAYHGAVSAPFVPTPITSNCFTDFSAGFVDLARRFRRKCSRGLKRPFKVAARNHHEVPVQELVKELKKEPEIYVQPVNESPRVILESPPPELRLTILSHLDFKDLRALAHASPVYHEQYVLDRKSLLFSSFMHTLRGGALDAQMAFHSGSKPFLQARSKESVIRFMQSYAKYGSSTPWASPHGMSPDGTACENVNPYDIFTLDDVLSMMKFHNSVVKPLAQHFADWALQNLAQLPGARAFSAPLTETEEARIYRAFYRYQVCANVFGFRRGIDEKRKEKPSFDGVEILAALEEMFEPWETEELTCVTLFFETRCREIFTAVQWDFDRNNPLFKERRQGASDRPIDFEDYGDEFKGGLLSQGLPVLNTLLVQAKDHSHLVSTLRKHLVYRMEGYFLGNLAGDAFGLDTLDYRMVRGYCERDFKQHRRDPLPFQGDNTMDPYGVFPPLAWTLLWMGTYSNRLGIWIQAAIQRWGYVFWDSFRMECTGAKEVLETQWTQDYWRKEDPRRHLDSAGRVIPGSDDDLHAEGIFPVPGPRFPIRDLKY